MLQSGSTGLDGAECVHVKRRPVDPAPDAPILASLDMN
jgi:hypothetical protein